MHFNQNILYLLEYCKLSINSVANLPPPMHNAGAPADGLKELSKDLEATFLAEMLKSAGFGETPEVFGGGTGEDQFASFLVQEYSKKIVEAGGIGLAEQIFHSLNERSK